MNCFCRSVTSLYRSVASPYRLTGKGKGQGAWVQSVPWQCDTTPPGQGEGNVKYESVARVYRVDHDQPEKACRTESTNNQSQTCTNMSAPFGSKGSAGEFQLLPFVEPLSLPLLLFLFLQLTDTWYNLTLEPTTGHSSSRPVCCQLTC